MLTTGAQAASPGGLVVRSADSYAMELVAIGGATATDLTIEIRPRAEQPAVTELQSVTLAIKAPGRAAALKVLRHVAVENGSAAIELRPLPSETRLLATAFFHAGTSRSTYVLSGRATVDLLPDLAVTTIAAPPQTLTTRPVDIVATVRELNRDLGADATVNLRWGPSLLATQPISMKPGGWSEVTFPGIALPDPTLVELTVSVDDVSQTDFDPTNNARTTPVDVSTHEVVPSSLVVPSLGGYGVQFNQHVYAAITPAPPGSLVTLEDKVKALDPQLVRIFFNEQQEATADKMASFVETVALAQESGATIDITYQTASRAKSQPDLYMGRFAAVLDDLVRVRGLTGVHWVTIQNEPNSTAVTLAQYEALYRALHTQLVELGLQDRIGLMGGDLVATDQREWFGYMATHMNDILDAYSVHVYWDYWDIPKMELRLRDVRKIVAEELPVEARKPTFITEFGPRGIKNSPGKPVVEPGYWSDGTALNRTNIAAFQQLWFNIESAQLGFAGTAKWDAYWAKYDNGTQAYWMIGPPEEGWPLFPTYYAMQLLLQTTERGWEVLGTAPWADDDWKLNELGKPFDQPELEIAAYRGPAGELTVLGLDSHARGLNGPSPDPAGSFSIGGLPPLTAFTLAQWNATGDGTNSIVGSVTTSAAGVARFTVPQHAAFALTTVPVS